MCLLFAKIKETTEDIVCYKVYVSFEGKLVSPYRRFPAPNINEIIETHLGEPYGEFNSVDEGFHSFATLKDAIENRKKLLECNPKVIIKCIIPKDSKCYVGFFDGRTSYCSESIILKETIDVK